MSFIIFFAFFILVGIAARKTGRNVPLCLAGCIALTFLGLAVIGLAIGVADGVIAMFLIPIIFAFVLFINPPKKVSAHV